MLPKIQAMALDGVTVECRESTEKSTTPAQGKCNNSYKCNNSPKSNHSHGQKPLNRLRHPGQFEMICYQIPDNSTFRDSDGKFNWDHIHEENTIYPYELYGSGSNYESREFDGDFMTMETSFNLTKFELWILSDRCNPNNHCFPWTDRLYNLMMSGNIL